MKRRRNFKCSIVVQMLVDIQPWYLFSLEIVILTYAECDEKYLDRLGLEKNFGHGRVM